MKTYNLKLTTYCKKKFWVASFVGSCLLFVATSASAQSTYGGTNVPYIHPRSEWLSTEALQNLFTWYPYSPSPDSQAPDYYPPRQIILHDTGCNTSRPGCNDDSIPTIAQIQNIFRFHSVTRGWGDIGYHFIIDRKGEIYEGKYGGATVRGGHLYYSKTCQNFNVGSIGIVLLGNYYDASIPQPMLDSVTRLAAWLAVTNNINLSQASTTIPVWTNRKDANGKCVAGPSNNDASDNSNSQTALVATPNGGFTTTFSGPPLLTHRDVEPTNSDIRNINIRMLRENALGLVPELNQYAYTPKEGNSSTNNIFTILNSSLQIITDSTKKVITLLKTQLDFFRPEQFAKKPEPKIIVQVPSFPDGTLLKATSTEEIYVIKDQKRTSVSPLSLFSALSLRPENVKEIDSSIINAIPLDKKILLPDATLIKSQTADIYYIDKGKRYAISSFALFKKLKFNIADIINLTQNELLSYPSGGYIKWPEGTILQNQSKKKEIYIIKKGSLKKFTGKLTKKTLSQLVAPQELTSYQTASAINANGTLSLQAIIEKIKTKLVPPAPIITLASSPPPSATNTSGTREKTIRIALCNHRDSKNCAFNTKDNLSIRDNGNGTMTVEGYEDRPGFSPALNDNTFRGRVNLVPSSETGKVWLINELPLEDYLKGIGETAATDAPEYRRAHTIMSRTYAYYYLTQEKRYLDKPFDLTNTSLDQVYRGYNLELRSNGLSQLVDDTKGKIITYQGKPIVSAYSSDSGGVSKNGCVVWIKYCTPDGKLKQEFSYLVGGIRDPEGTIHDPEKIKASHGVGVSTAGARKLIEQGKTYEELIKYYYPGVEIQLF